MSNCHSGLRSAGSADYSLVPAFTAIESDQSSCGREITVTRSSQITTRPSGPRYAVARPSHERRTVMPAQFNYPSPSIPF